MKGKITALILSVTLAAGCIAGCGQSEKNAQNKGDSSARRKMNKAAMQPQMIRCITGRY